MCLGKVKCWIFLCTVIYDAFADKKDFPVFSRTQYIYKLEINIFFLLLLAGSDLFGNET